MFAVMLQMLYINSYYTRAQPTLLPNLANCLIICNTASTPPCSAWIWLPLVITDSAIGNFKPQHNTCNLQVYIVCYDAITPHYRTHVLFFLQYISGVCPICVLLFKNWKNYNHVYKTYKKVQEIKLYWISFSFDSWCRSEFIPVHFLK